MKTAEEHPEFKPNILIVDDRVENLVVLERVLADVPADIVRAKSGNEALGKLLSRKFALVLMDVHMPEMDGFETVELMRQDKDLKDLPVIFLSAVYKDDFYKIRGVRSGALDFITKPIVPEILRGKVKIFLELHKSKTAREQENERRRQSEESLRELSRQLEEVNVGLEEKVAERTASLRRSNESLRREIEERKQAEKKLKDAQAKLIETEKIAAIGTLTAGIAHELNNPLMGILNFIQYCVRKTSPEQPIHEVLKDAEEATGDCIEIIRNLLTFAHTSEFGEQSRTEADLVLLFDRVVHLMSYRIEKENVTVEKNIDENAHVVVVGVTEIQQVFLNLVTNALDSMIDSNEKRITFAIKTTSERAQIEIRDTGCGIDEKTRGLIFDPFFTTKPVGKGTGLGLYMSKGIIDRHGGTISCESEPGRGTRFKIVLPNEVS